MNEQTQSERDEAAYQFALKLWREDRLPSSRSKDYKEQMAALRAEFESQNKQ